MGGKDKGKDSEIVRVLPEKDQLVVAGVNQYVKHRKPIGGRPGEKVVLDRPLPTAKVAVLNDKGQPDRVGFIVAKDGTKTRIFKKTGKTMTEPKLTVKKSK
jgi:large subunit ribosomal protein L24